MLCVALDSLSQSESLHTATTFYSLQVSIQPVRWLKSWKRLALPFSFLSCSATDFTKQLKMEMGVLASGEQRMRLYERLPVDNLLFAPAETLMSEKSKEKWQSWVPIISYLRTDICTSSRQGDLCHRGFTPVNQHSVDL